MLSGNVEVVQLFQQPTCGAECPPPRVLHPQSPDPRIEYLDGLGAVGDLGAEIGGHGIGKPVHEGVEGVGVV